MSGGWVDSGVENDDERVVRREGKRERRIAGGGTLVGGWGDVGSWGGAVGLGIVNGRAEGADGVTEEVKSSQGSSSSRFCSSSDGNDGGGFATGLEKLRGEGIV